MRVGSWCMVCLCYRWRWNSTWRFYSNRRFGKAASGNQGFWQWDENIVSPTSEISRIAPEPSWFSFSSLLGWARFLLHSFLPQKAPEIDTLSSPLKQFFVHREVCKAWSRTRSAFLNSAFPMNQPRTHTSQLCLQQGCCLVTWNTGLMPWVVWGRENGDVVGNEKQGCVVEMRTVFWVVPGVPRDTRTCRFPPPLCTLEHRHLAGPSHLSSYFFLGKKLNLFSLSFLVRLTSMVVMEGRGRLWALVLMLWDSIIAVLKPWSQVCISSCQQQNPVYTHFSCQLLPKAMLPKEKTKRHFSSFDYVLSTF